MSKYNGWTNWETWVINLWLTNEQEVYNETKTIIQETENTETETVLENFVDRLIDDKVITDKVSLHRVNWQEVIDAFKVV